MAESPRVPKPPAPGVAGPRLRQVPEGDNRERLICPDCGFVNYENPKIVVGCVAHWQDRILLCRRAIDPRAGFWTLPAGFMELRETPVEGALREAWEEARARIEIEALLAVYAIPRISQVQLIYRGRLLSPAVEPGPESAEVALFTRAEIPHDAIAFPSVRWALAHDREVDGLDSFVARSNPDGETGDFR